MNFLFQYLNIILQYFVDLDDKFGLIVSNALRAYSFPTSHPSYLAANIVQFIKVSVYSLFLLIPLTALKLLRRENKIIFVLFSFAFITFAVSTFAIFLGFLQLLFT